MHKGVTMKSLLVRFFLPVSMVLLTACEGEFTVGGNVSGLSGGELVLQNNSSDDESIRQNGSYEFDTELSNGESYFVTVRQQPAGHTCTVANASGDVEDEDVNNVNVTCNAEPITVSSASGIPQSLDGTWSSCQFNAVQDEKQVWVISNSTVEKTIHYYNSTNASCSGDPFDSTDPVTTVLSSAGESAAGTIFWDNGQNMVTAPAASGGGFLPDQPIVTKIQEHSNAGIFNTIRFIDDSDEATPWRLYQNGNAQVIDCNQDEQSGFPTCLLNIVAAEKQ